jgi:hypothetical protein
MDTIPAEDRLIADRTTARNNLIIGNCLALVKALGKWYGPIKLSVSQQTRRLQSRMFMRHPDRFRDDLTAELSENWFEWFDVELISPKGLWIATQWNILNKIDTIRLSMYDTDTLLVLELCSSEWFQQLKLDGWICQQPYELMLVHPKRLGIMKKVTDVFLHDNPDCDFEG